MLSYKGYTPYYTFSSVLKYVKAWLFYIFYRYKGIIEISFKGKFDTLIVHLLLDKSSKSIKEINEELISLLEDSILYRLTNSLFDLYDISNNKKEILEALKTLREKGIVVEIQQANNLFVAKKYCLSIYCHLNQN